MISPQITTTSLSKPFSIFPSFPTQTMASPTLITPTSKFKPLPSTPIKSKLTTTPTTTTTTTATTSTSSTTPTSTITTRRHLTITALTAAILTPLISSRAAHAAENEEYVKETQEVISKVRYTLAKNKTDPDVADAVADLRATSNSWVAKYRKEKDLLGKPSFRDMYSALNAVSGHYISFGPTAPIPSKRRARILEEMDTAEKALLRGR